MMMTDYDYCSFVLCAEVMYCALYLILHALLQSKMLEELDAQFGIGDPVEQDMTEKKTKKYTHNHLTGLQVQHAMSRSVVYSSLRGGGYVTAMHVCFTQPSLAK